MGGEGTCCRSQELENCERPARTKVKGCPDFVVAGDIDDSSGFQERNSDRDRKRRRGQKEETDGCEDEPEAEAMRSSSEATMSISRLDLEIYVEKGCRTCRRSLELADYVRRRFPDIEVRIIDGFGSRGRHEDLVFATPTFILNGGRVSLGNPSVAQLEAAIVAAMKDLAV